MTKYTFIAELTGTGCSAYLDHLGDGACCTTGENEQELMRNILEALSLFLDREVSRDEIEIKFE